MGTIWLKEFTGGLDTRRLPETTPGGVLIRARDGHITRGGEFEKRAAFVKFADLPADTKGLAFGDSGPVVFGSDPVPTLPAGIAYQRLQSPANRTLARVLSSERFAGKVYAIAQYDDDSIEHFYDGAIVSSWGDLGYRRGTFARTAGRKIYSVAGPNAHFSALSTPTQFDPSGDPAGAGFIVLSEESAGAEDVLSIARYQDKLAFFSERTIQLWAIDPDPALNRQLQVLQNTGTLAPKSITQFGDADVFYLDASGLRSLKARDSSEAAATTDIGVFVDDLIVSDLAALTPQERLAITGLIEPSSGRFWLAVKGRIFVFSYFSGAKVSAWSTYEPGFVVDDMIAYRRKVYLRSGNALYVYGGTGDAVEYDTTEAEAWLPYLDAGRPSEFKKWQGIDVACRGSWEVRIGMDLTNETANDRIATVAGTTYNHSSVGGVGEATHVNVRLRSKGDGPAQLGAVVLHYEGGGTDGE